MPIKVKKKILVLIMSHEYPHYIICVSQAKVQKIATINSDVPNSEYPNPN
jgi:diaminopimelate epimerase